tara:strand:- start:775 stop:1080 length:306 start_codon:yes stop_codon:yes gene_type:complete
MAFKIKPPYEVSNQPVYYANLEEGVLGKTNNNASIVLDSELPVDMIKKVCDHEDIHVDQIKRGDLSYDDNYVYWKGKKYSRAQMEEGAKNLPWEAEAYKNS